MAEPERILELPKPLTDVTEVRSTLILSSLKQLQATGYMPRYEAQLDASVRQTILESSAPAWLPIAIADAHYRACDGLRLSAQEQLMLGQGVGEAVQNTWFGTLVRVARAGGMTPWQYFGQMHRLWARAFRGGGIGLVKVGPTESLLEIRGVPLLQYEYFRRALCGVLAAPVRLFSAEVTITTESLHPDAKGIVLRGCWK